MKKIGRLISYFSTLLFIFLLIILLSVTYMAAKGDIPRVFGYSIMRIVTGSMETELPVDTYVLVKEVDVDELKKGDIVSFFRDIEGVEKNATVTHRIFDIFSEDGKLFFITKGDVNTDVDSEPVPEDKIIGIVTDKLPIMDFFSGVLSNPVVFLITIIVPITIMLVLNITDVARAAKHRKKNLQRKNWKPEGELNKSIEPDIPIHSEEQLKQRIIAEYLANQAKDVQKNADDKN